MSKAGRTEDPTGGDPTARERPPRLRLTAAGLDELSLLAGLDLDQARALSRSFELRALRRLCTDRAGPRVSIIAYTGGPLDPLGQWPRPGVLDVASLVLPRSLPVLLDHAVGRPLGWGRPIRRGGQLVVEGQLSSPGPNRDAVLAAAHAGFQWKASCAFCFSGAQASIVPCGERLLQNGHEFTAGGRGLELVIGAIVREVSLVIDGRDGSATVAIDLAARQRGEGRRPAGRRRAPGGQRHRRKR